ncbi:MAG: cytochrome b5 domain-containing protein [Desulfobacterales bacterium]|jgi:predicted heme/steroid binding protein/uncharacterized membrane protein|nr:cytochrome b5 domain-containing protein [Desulfobacterales bacterium]
MKTFHPEALATCDGQNGQPVYIAHKGRVFDVTHSKLWKNGLHMKRHHAGRDLTADILAAPHGEEMLARYPQIGIIGPTSTDEDVKIPALLSRLLRKFPFLRRHPHPMTVHFPIVFMTAAPVFTILYLITGVASFETTAFHCLGAGILFTIVAISTGLYTWWLNYLSKPTRPVMIKKRLSSVMLVVAFIAFFMRITHPTVLCEFNGLRSVLYLLLLLALLPMVTIIGWFGAQLTFPLEKE